MIAVQKLLPLIVLLFGFIALPEFARSDEPVSGNDIRIGTIFSHDEVTEGRLIRTRVIAEYFKKINNDGGISGRKVVVIAYDDEDNSKKTLDLARTLVDRDHVACLFDLNARANEIVHPYVRLKKIPVLFHWVPSLRQAKILGSYVSRHLPDSTIAMIRPANSEYTSGFYEGLGMERARTSIAHADEIKKLDERVNQVELVSIGRSGLFAMFGPETLQLKLSRDLAKLDWKPVLVMSDAALSLDHGRLNPTAQIISIANENAVTSLDSAKWKTFSRVHLPQDDWDSNAAAYGYSLARSIELILRDPSEVNRCKLDVVRFSGRNWDIAEPGIPCEPEQLRK